MSKTADYQMTSEHRDLVTDLWKSDDPFPCACQSVQIAQFDRIWIDEQKTPDP